MEDYYIPGSPRFDSDGAKNTFSRIGWALFTLILLSQGVALLLATVVQALAMGGSLAMIRFMQSDWFVWVLTDVASYGFGLPAFLLIIRAVPNAEPPVRRRVTAKQFGGLFLVSYAALYLFNLLGLLVTGGIGLLRGKEVSNLLVDTVSGSNEWVVLLFAVVLAPVVEEFVFRGVLLRKLRGWGEPLCIFASGFSFALFHGNLNQIFYAFAIGCLFAYVTLRTGTILWSILLHAAVNFVGSFVPTVITNADNIILMGLFGWCILAVVISGIVIFVQRRKTLHFHCGTQPVGEGEKRRLLLGNSGMIAYMTVSFAVIIYTTFFYG